MHANPRIILVGLAVAGFLGSLAVGPLSAAAEDVVAEDVVAENGVAGADAAPPDEPAADEMQRFLALQAGIVTLGWRDGRLELDEVAMRAKAFGPDFDRHRAVVQAVVEKAPQLLADEAVANGLPRDVAEKAFAAGRVFKEPDHGWPSFGGERDAQHFALAKTGVKPIDLFVHVYHKAHEQRMFQANGMSMSGGSDGYTIEIGAITFRFAEKGQRLHYGVSHAGAPRRSLTLTADGPVLTIEWESGGDADGEGAETVRIKQAADRFRLVHLRDDEVVMKLEGRSFRDCCRANVDAVRRELPALLRRMGIGPPALPDDAAVQAEVVARLRRAAGRPAPAAADAEIAAAKYRIAQASGVIDAFGLLDDAAYLGGLKATATGDDAAAIESRLEALAAGRK